MANQKPKRQDKTEYDIFAPEQRPHSNAAEVLPKILLYNGLLLLTVLTNIYILDPTSRFLFPTLSTAFSIMYLPFAIKLIVGFFEGFRAPFYLLPGAIFIDAYFFMGEHLSYSRLLAVFFCYSLPPIAFAVTDWLVMSDRRVDFSHPRTWRNLYVAGFIASSLCALMMYGVEDRLDDVNLRQGIKILVSFIFGDLAGLTAILLLGMASVKIYTRWQHR